MRSVRKASAALRIAAEAVLAGLLGVMFFAFMVQIVFRYFFNLPTGWTTELTVVTWLWLVLWGAAFVLWESEEIRIDLVTSLVGRRGRIAAALVSSLVLLALYCLALPASYKYVSFMSVEKSSYLKIPMNWLFSIFILFLVAVIVRYVWLVWQLLRGRDPGQADPTKATSAL
jgi:TRAP-type C4-dicarboxylate transport system permease small subunit